MEAREIELIEKFQVEDAELKALYEQHVQYEKLLNKLEAKSYLSSAEQQEVKELKKKKLAGKTKLQSMLEHYVTGD
ncbi:DUF465 domain-containing protein [Desulfovibrio oxyclinae]|jgi:hypothetical protein|uniref:DUF465 domain-containing protein n=1 Tax=Desulfovibrio oxyclinae TaxID=63560 RepID=UPI00035CDD14|nr:DUF465 domain-containing protein [Desulfovibrio oxyclinae]